MTERRLRPRKSSLVSRNCQGEFFLSHTHPHSQIYVYQNICFLFHRKSTHTHTHTHTHTRKAKETEEQKKEENVAVAVVNSICEKSNKMLLVFLPTVATTQTLNIAPVLSKDFLDIQATIKSRLTLKRARDMITTYRQQTLKCTEQISTHNAA